MTMMTTAKTLISTIKSYIHSAWDVLMPRTCPACRHALSPGEPYVCRKCLDNLPRTLFETRQFNSMEQLFAGKTPIYRATAYFYYRKRSPYTNIILDTKYRNSPRLGEWFGAYVASQILSSGFFQGIHCIIPVPMHSSKLHKRGYNQADYIAQGISRVTGIPIAHNVVAVMPHDTQTRKSIYDRWKNTQGLFDAVNTQELENKHVLLVDDVVTTGATLLSCAKTIEAVPGIKVSLMTLASAVLD